MGEISVDRDDQEVEDPTEELAPEQMAELLSAALNQIEELRHTIRDSQANQVREQNQPASSTSLLDELADIVHQMASAELEMAQERSNSLKEISRIFSAAENEAREVCNGLSRRMEARWKMIHEQTATSSTLARQLAILLGQQVMGTGSGDSNGGSGNR